MLKSTKNFLYVGSILTLMFIAINQFFVRAGTLELISSTILYPFLVTQNKIIKPIRNFILNFYSSYDLKELINFYKKENEDLTAELIKLHGINSYALAIKEVSDFASRYKTENYIISQVLLRNFDKEHHFILIDAGSLKGVEKDMIVVHKNCLIGKVVEVYRYYSKVLTISDKECKVAAYCVSNGIQGIHVGKNDICNSELTFVNHLDTVQKGDLVLSSGEGIIFPRGFALGKIDKSIKEDFNYIILVRTLIDFNKLDFCCVIKKEVSLKDEKHEYQSLTDIKNDLTVVCESPLEKGNNLIIEQKDNKEVKDEALEETSLNLKDIILPINQESTALSNSNQVLDFQIQKRKKTKQINRISRNSLKKSNSTRA